MRDLDDDERARLLARVAAERARTTARAEALARDLDDIVRSSAESVKDDEHDPEGATIAFERAQVASLLADARHRLGALDAAEVRLRGPEANRCERCGGEIGVERIEARPAAVRCVRCAT
jgi:DnaK suppressor protein